MKKTLIFLLLVVVASCSSVQVSYDIDKSVNFGKFKTYAYTQEALALGVGDLDRGRIINAVDAQMTARGMTKSDNPDALVDLVIKTKQEETATATNTGGYGYGRYGWGGGMSTTQVTVSQFTVGTLFVNVIDKSTEKIAWQGRGTQTLDPDANPNKKESNITNAVRSIFYNYPIKPKSGK